MPEFDAEKLRFGAHGTDHMLSVDYNLKKGGKNNLIWFFLIYFSWLEIIYS